MAIALKPRMKNTMLALLPILLLAACGDGDHSKDPVIIPPPPPQPPTSFGLASPANGAGYVSTTPTFSWTDSSGETGYHIEVATDAAFASIVVSDASIPANTTSTSAGLSAGTTYYWRVTAMNGAGSTMASNAPYSFTTVSAPPPGPFTQISPANGAIDIALKPTFTWTASVGAVDYHLEVSLSATFIPLVYDNPAISGTSFQLATPLAPGTVHYWRVTAQNAAGDTVASNAAFAFTTMAAPPAWAKSYGGSNDDYARAVAPIAAGGCFVAGHTKSFGAGNTDAWVLKLAADGTIAWQKAYGTSGVDEAWSVDATFDGGCIFAGKCSNDLWIVKLNSDGLIDWQKRMTAAQADGAYVVKQTADLGYIVGGYTNTFGSGLNDAWVLRLTATGVIQWQVAIGSGMDEVVKAIVETTNGFLLGVRSWNGADPDIALVELDTNGAILWQQAYGDPGWHEIKGVVGTSDGGFVVTGTMNSADGNDIFLMKAAADGTVVWAQSYDSPWGLEANAIRPTSDGGFVIAGAAQMGDPAGNAGVVWDALIFKTDSVGDIVWQKSYAGMVGEDHLDAVGIASDAGILAVGRMDTTTPGGFDMWVLKTDSSGAIPPMSTPDPGLFGWAYLMWTSTSSMVATTTVSGVSGIGGPGSVDTNATVQQQAP